MQAFRITSQRLATQETPGRSQPIRCMTDKLGPLQLRAAKLLALSCVRGAKADMAGQSRTKQSCSLE